MLTAAEIISEAKQAAKVLGFDVQALRELNAILSDLAEGYDFAIARGLFEFDFNPGLQSNFGSGPYQLPVDYLRASGSSGEGQKAFWWTLQGVPYPMVPCDLSEFDMQVQQAGLQSYPWLWATDMSNASMALSSRYKKSFAAGLTLNSTTATVVSVSGIDVDDGIAGEGIVPGTTIAAVGGVTLSTTGDTHSNTTLDVLGSTTGVVVGQPVSGPGIPSGTTVAALVSGTQVTLSQAVTASATTVAILFSGGALTLSAAAAATLSSASVFTGVPPEAYAYPPPSGAYPVSIRYQRQMPPIIDTSRMVWFPNEGYLIDELTGRLMQITDDSRTTEFMGDGLRPGRAERRLQRFLGQIDDKKNRPQSVELDRRRFGPSMKNLPFTKSVGWVFAICAFLPILSW